jgi:hypothetical protein
MFLTESTRIAIEIVCRCSVKVSGNGKALLAQVQAILVAQQFEKDREARSVCSGSGERQRIKDYRPRAFDTVFGGVSVNQVRFESVRCRPSVEPGPPPRGYVVDRGRSFPSLLELIGACRKQRPPAWPSCRSLNNSILQCGFST